MKACFLSLLCEKTGNTVLVTSMLAMQAQMLQILYLFVALFIQLIPLLSVPEIKIKTHIWGREIRKWKEISKNL